MLPKHLLSVPNNPLLKELEGVFSFNDPIVFSSEFSRELLYHNVNFLKFILLKDFFIYFNNNFITNNFNTSFLNNYLFFYFFNNYNNEALNNNFYFYKNQYRPMKKGVTNMIRLHATGAVAMPIEIRLHILASSKDVIHS